MRRETLLAVTALVLLPLVWLSPHVLGDRLFVPYDVDQFAPANLTLAPEELAAARDGANLDVTEVPIWFLPELRLAHDELAAGRLPTWNPNARHGAPLHAHGLIGLLYPPNWPALLAAAPADRLGLVAWANLALAGLLAFGLFRSLGHGRLPAWFGAAVLQLSLPMAANAFFWMRLGSFVWLPGILWSMHVLTRADRARALPMAAVAGSYAMVWLAGFPPFAATATVFAGLWFVWLVAVRARERGGRDALRLAILLGAALLLGACWALPQVLPSLAFFPESARDVTPAWRDVAAQTFEPYALFGYLMPDAFGDPTTAARLPYGASVMQLLWTTHVGVDGKVALPNYNFTEHSVFVSTFAIVLALVGAVAGRGRNAWFARLALLLGVGLGMFWPVLRLLFHLPVVQNVWPMRWLAATTPFVVWAAVLGMERLLAVERGRRALPLAAAGVAGALALGLWYAGGVADEAARSPGAVVEALADRYQCSDEAVRNHVCGEGQQRDLQRLTFGPEHFAGRAATGAVWLLGTALLLAACAFVPQRRVRLGLVGVAVAASLAQLALAGRAVTRGTDDHVHDDTPVHAFLRERAAATSAQGGFTIVRATAVEGLPSQLPPGQVMARGVRDLNFYSHADARTLEPVQLLLERFRALLPEGAPERIAGKGYLTSALPAQLLQLPLFDLMNVRYALATEDLSAHGLTRRVGPELARGPRRAFYVYERPNARPRAWVAPRVVALPDDDAVLAAITRDDLRPAAQAFVVDDGTSWPEPTADAAPRAVTFTRDEPTRVELDVAAGPARALVLADTFLPGWTATIDGEPAPLHRANHSQRLVVLPERACTVAMTYAAPGLTKGLLVSTFATLSWIATLLWRARRRRAAAADG